MNEVTIKISSTTAQCLYEILYERREALDFEKDVHPIDPARVNMCCTLVMDQLVHMAGG